MVLLGLIRKGLLIGLVLASFEAFAQVPNPVINENEQVIIRSPDHLVSGPFQDPSFLNKLRKQTDAYLFEPVDLKKKLGILDEAPLVNEWVPTRQMVQVSEKIRIDSIWVTAHEYFSLWDSWKIDIYEFDPMQLRDTISLKLYEVRAPGGWSLPLPKREVSSKFGRRGYRWHHGVDLRLNQGEPVYCVFDGIVRVKSFDRYGYGHFVLVRHLNGLETLYGHLSKTEVEVGQELTAGSIIGFGGNTGRSTGPHLHFEVRYHGVSLDPEEVFDFDAGKPKSPTFRLHAQHFAHLKEARESIYHSVKSGENLSLIGRKYGVSLAHITKMNNLNKHSVLRIGQRLRIR
ncbi:peptidoglycan DD-metalloendopeptidase family protein [Pleomorphovibrio marinus]|uniref:peptidoglycan DD-metalloendopeptidase family protein n=1 Tax=Pleomorphovibrio marinus TaxID=2164132 RepID=UPI000E0A65AC|nr:peptidoglycan DD-metalloendopeptidase family protein [Pleomorphovibrio marinus]